MVSQRTLAFIKVWEKCLNGSDWEFNDILGMNIESRVARFTNGTDILNNWEYCLWFSDFVEHINVELFVLNLSPEIARDARFSELEISKGDADSEEVLFKNFHATLENVLHNPREWAAAYVDTSRKNGYEINRLDFYIPNEFWENGINGKKWELFKFKVISAGLIIHDPSDAEWDHFFSRRETDLSGNVFAITSVAGKVKLAMLSSTFETALSGNMIDFGLELPWFDVIESPKLKSPFPKRR